jgi:hypothetical protein
MYLDIKILCVKNIDDRRAGPEIRVTAIPVKDSGVAIGVAVSRLGDRAVAVSIGNCKRH